MSVIESTSTYYTLRNLATQELERLPDHPLYIAPDLPDYRPREKEFWNEISFEGYHISLVRPLNSTKRVSKENFDVSFGGIILDMDDVHIDKEDMIKHIEKVIDARYRPQFIAESYSGGFHLHFEFTEPIPTNGKAAYKKFVETFVSKACLRTLPGEIDMRAVTDPAHVFEIGRDWTPVRSQPISKTVVLGIRQKMVASTRDRWAYSKDVDVPIARVQEILQRKYPDSKIDWDDFGPGTRCHRFWDPEADNETAVRVYTNGVYPFTGMDGFKPWSHPDLLGREAVEEILDAKLALAIKGIYQDGTGYWRKLSNRWVRETLSSIKIALKASGLQGSPPRGETISELESALELINQTQRIVGAGPCLFRKPGTMRTLTGELFLNTSAVTPYPASTGEHPWGHDFPMISQFFDTCFRDDAREFLLWWLAHAYQGAISHRPSQGLGVILIGDPGIGKNFLGRGIIGNLFGGVVDPQAFLLGSDGFNLQAFNKPVWYLSDIPHDLRPSQMRVFSDNLKKTLADDTVRARGMYSEAVEITWHGRLMMACNSDSASLDAIPSTGALYDKLAYMEMIPTKMPVYPSDEELMSGELGAFAAYLRDLVIPEDQLCSRFGILPFHDPIIQGIIEAGDISLSREELVIRILGMMGGNYQASGVEYPKTVTATEIFEFARMYPNEGFQATFQTTIANSMAVGRILAKLGRTDPRIKKAGTSRSSYLINFKALQETE